MTLPAEERDALVLENTAVVARAANKVYRHTRLIDREDLIGIGNLALVRSAGRWEPWEGGVFGVFAWKHVYGSMIDALRRTYGIHHESYREGARWVPCEIPGDLVQPPPDRYYQGERADFEKILSLVGTRAASALRMRYCDGMTNLQISSALGVNESRASVICSVSLGIIRRALKIAPPPLEPRRDFVDREAVLARSAAGESDNAIAASLRVGYRIVANIVRSDRVTRGLPRRSPGAKPKTRAAGA